jgi:hypothetical protein
MTPSNLDVICHDSQHSVWSNTVSQALTSTEALSETTSQILSNCATRAPGWTYHCTIWTSVMPSKPSQYTQLLPSRLANREVHLHQHLQAKKASLLQASQRNGITAGYVVAQIKGFGTWATSAIAANRCASRRGVPPKKQMRRPWKEQPLLHLWWNGLVEALLLLLLTTRLCRLPSAHRTTCVSRNQQHSKPRSIFGNSKTK